eukprot:1158128-Pelagomonas_calceolata.AAC.7
MRDWIGSLFYTRTWRSPSHTRSQGCTVRGSQSVVSAPVAIVSRHLAGNEGHTGPLLPRHIRRAYQQLELADKGPPRKQPRKRMTRVQIPPKNIVDRHNISSSKGKKGLIAVPACVGSLVEAKRCL